MLRLTADYECHPLWDTDTGNVDPSTLAIPDELARALADWAGEYTRTLDRSHPPASGFRDASTEAAWVRRGAELATALRACGFDVEYREGAGPAPDP